MRQHAREALERRKTQRFQQLRSQNTLSPQPTVKRLKLEKPQGFDFTRSNTSFGTDLRLDDVIKDIYSAAENYSKKRKEKAVFSLSSTKTAYGVFDKVLANQIRVGFADPVLEKEISPPLTPVPVFTNKRERVVEVLQDVPVPKRAKVYSFEGLANPIKIDGCFEQKSPETHVAVLKAAVPAVKKEKDRRKVRRVTEEKPRFVLANPIVVDACL